VFVIGYFQDPAFLTPVKATVRNWLLNGSDDSGGGGGGGAAGSKRFLPQSPAPKSASPASPSGASEELALMQSGYPPVGASDIVAHVRCCQHSGGGCDWLYLPFE